MPLQRRPDERAGKSGILDTCKRPPFSQCLLIDIFVFLCIALYFHYRGFFGFGRILIPPEPRLNPNSPRASFAPCPGPTGPDILRRARCVFASQKLLPGGDPPGPLEEREKETMARPRLGEEERRGRTVGVRVTEAEAEELQERAQGARLSVAAAKSSFGGLPAISTWSPLPVLTPTDTDAALAFQALAVK